jgi:hypothetical protein
LAAYHDRQIDDPLPFLIRRSPAPEWLDDPTVSQEPRIYDALGEQAEWGFATPWIHRALASPLTREPVLEAPKSGSDQLRGPPAYWSSLLHLLVYGLGWVRPDRGLRWWYDSGKPVADRTLQLISQVWGADGQLDWFAAWLWSTAWSDWGELVKEATGYVIGQDGLLEDVPLAPDDPWLDARKSEADSSGISAPLSHGGWDPLHLSIHIDGALQPVSGQPLLVRTRAADRRAVLILDSMIGWYRALATESRSLPKLSGHSWRVEVVVKPVGWLGTYRKSGQSGLWFTGSHSVHMRGI